MSDSPRLGQKLLLATLLATALAAIVSVGCMWFLNSLPDAAMRAKATTAVPAENRPIVRPPVRLASIPWKRTPSEPLHVIVPVAKTLWQNDVSEPSPVKLVLAALPWTRQLDDRPARGVSLQYAAWPWRANLEEQRRTQVPVAAVPWAMDSDRPSPAVVKLAALPDWPLAKPTTRPTSGPSLSALQPEM